MKKIIFEDWISKEESELLRLALKVKPYTNFKIEQSEDKLKVIYYLDNKIVFERNLENSK